MLQIVLLEAGGNDFSNGTKPPANWAADYQRFLQQVCARIGPRLCVAQAVQAHLARACDCLLRPIPSDPMREPYASAPKQV